VWPAANLSYIFSSESDFPRTAENSVEFVGKTIFQN
jgi:hypothetical protein